MMKWSEFFCGVALGSAMIFVPGKASAQQRPKPKPNVVIIEADGIGYTDLGCYGADKVKTPNIDKLGKEGMEFMNFYSMPSSSSFVSLLTGCYPKRIGIVSDPGPKANTMGLNPAEITVAELVKPNGYATCMVGEWHAGQNKIFLPQQQGFDEFFGIPYGHDMSKQFNSEYGDLPLMDGDKTVETNPDQSQLTKRYTDRAVDFITKHSSAPFLLYVSHSMPHNPVAVSRDFAGKSKGGLFYDAVSEVDWSVGQIMKTLQKLAIDRQTIFIFFSGYGPEIVYGNRAGSTGGFKEGVNTVFEGGVRVPLIIRYPEREPGGSNTQEFASVIDIFPTVADLTRSTLPAAKMDGIDLWPVLSNMEKILRARKIYYYYLGNQLLAVRQGAWKLYLPHEYPSVTDEGKDGKPGKIEMKKIELSLFNLDEDPSETNNVALANRELVLKLQALIEAYDKELEQNKREAGKAVE